MFNHKALRTGLYALALIAGTGWTFPGPVEETQNRGSAPVAASGDSAYSSETDTVLLRRAARRQKVTRTLMGNSLAIAGTISAAAGFLGMVAEDFVGESSSRPEAYFGLGLTGLGTGLFMLGTPWSAERRWNRLSEKVLLGFRSDGRGVRLAVRF